MRILNIKNIIAFVFAWNPKEDRRITAYVSYAIRRSNGEYLKTILIKLGFIAYAELASNCSVLHNPRYVFYPPIDLQPNQAIATIYLGDYDISPSELGPERFNRTLDTCKELACNLKSHIKEIEYIDQDCIYNLEESDKELFGKYVCVVKDDGSEHRSLTTEWNSHHNDYLVPSELTKDASEQLDHLFVDTSLHHTDEKADNNTETNPNENKKIDRVLSYVFLVMNLVPFECKIYVICDGTGDGESLGTLKQSPFHDGDLLFLDADKVPLFSFTPKADSPTKLHNHGTVHVIRFMKDVATKFIKFAQQSSYITARKVKNVPELVEGCHVYTAHPLTAYITYHNPEKRKVSTLDVDKIAKNISQAIVAVENDQSCALFVKDPINGNEYTLNITGFDNDGRLLANVVRIMK